MYSFAIFRGSVFIIGGLAKSEAEQKQKAILEKMHANR